MADQVKPTARVAISVLTYERPHATKLFFEKLWEHTPYTPFDLFVVDNGSQEGTVDVLNILPDSPPAGGSVHLILLQENAGWCPAKNIGLALAKGRYDYVVLIENDCVCYRTANDWAGHDWLSMHINALESLDLDILQGRHAPKQHGDEGYIWRLRKQGGS
jgi:GT2 family glycosyltransferase